MAAIRGTEGVVEIAGSPVASVRSFTVDTTQDTIEDTSMGVDSRTYVKGLRTFSGSADVVLDTTPQHAAASSPLDFFANEPTATVALYPKGSSETTTKISGDVIVTGYSISSSFDGIVEASIDFQGTGDLTYGA